jgi:hypothetical protein
MPHETLPQEALANAALPSRVHRQCIRGMFHAGYFAAEEGKTRAQQAIVRLRSLTQKGVRMRLVLAGSWNIFGQALFASGAPSSRVAQIHMYPHVK